MNIVKKIGFGLLLLLVGFGFYKLAKLYSPGSYPNAEIYGIRASEGKIINSINKFKDENPKFVPPISFNLQDGRFNANDHWYDVYFYYPESKEIVHVWTRPDGSGSTTIGFVGVNQGDRLGNWKDINRDFSSSENSIQKDRFENLILSPIRYIVEAKQ
ncbi:hypothetical protein TH53_25740 [Pedobacter lusitanus]|uniref:Contig167, whole genome shotgun sequence n=1 Tax=Pedobacter lusitanus TaxID=1503925 RepID=A0A0D0EYV3_9SPHI|nr:hypothetical protein [Pedobacter lusitanus]KIO74563.1 hypothetical protein TH53_25740 [Pedobacter lusitanus]